MQMSTKRWARITGTTRTSLYSGGKSNSCILCHGIVLAATFLLVRHVVLLFSGKIVSRHEMQPPPARLKKQYLLLFFNAKPLGGPIGMLLHKSSKGGYDNTFADKPVCLYVSCAS